MEWLNLKTSILHAPEYIGSDPRERATWFNVSMWCAQQENSGRIVGARAWKDRQWQQTCGVSRREVHAAGKLLTWDGEDMIVWNYPKEKQAEVQAKREAGRLGGLAKTEAKTQTARQNGALGGRPKTEAETKAVLDKEPKQSQSTNLTEGKGREGEGKGKEGNSSCPTSAPPSPDAEKFVAWFLDLLAETEAPLPKLTPSNRANWAQCYDRMVRLDGRTKEDVKEVCRWARNDPFWKGNFLSPMKLRERKDGVMWFDQWLLKARTPASHGTTPPPAPARMMEPEAPLATRHGESLLPPEDDVPPEGSP